MKKKYLLLLIIAVLGFAFWRLFLVQPAWKKLPVSKGLEPPWTQPETCRVKDFKLLGPGGGGAVWSPKEKDVFVYTRYDENNIKQIYRKNLTSGNEECLTCQPTNDGPLAKVHKGVPSFDPTGRYLVMQVEMEKHPYPFGQNIAEPGSGWFQDIWGLDLQKNRWQNLTNYPQGGVHGVLFPKISYNGTKIAWAEVYKGPDLPGGLFYLLGLTARGSVWGYWRINIADFVTDEKGVRLENIKQLKPGNATFYEIQDWSPDNKKIMFVSDIGLDSPHKLNIYILDTESNEFTAFTNDKSEWNEHATFTHSGEKIVYMSSKCCNWDVNDWKSLVAEFYLADSDGSNEVQLTHFNEEGYPESQADKGRAIATKGVFSPDGTKLLLEQILMTKKYTKHQTNLWLLTFQGACGKL